MTRREIEVLQHIVRGLTNAEITKAMFLNVRTIGTHRRNFMHKLNIHNAAGLVRYAMEHGLVPSDLTGQALPAGHFSKHEQHGAAL